MTGFNVVVDDREVFEALSRLRGALSDMTPVMNAIGAVMESNTRIRFDTKRDPKGTAWAPIKPSTHAAYERKYKGAPPGSLLDRSGPAGMRQSLSYVAYDDRVVIGFGKPYAIYHEFGTRKMDRRGLLLGDPKTGEIGDDDRRDVMDMLGRYLAGAIG